MKKALSLILAAAMLFAFASCDTKDADMVAELGLNADTKAATEQTVKINSAIYSVLDFEDKTEYEFAVKGLIDAPEELELKDADGKVIWSQKAYSFVDNYEECPDTVNPSLWENTKNNHAYGFFKVCENIYQVRGYDMANLTLIKGDTGWIIFDPLMSIECTQAAMQLVEKNFGKLPVKAVIVSHPHVDHYGGIKGVINDEQVADSNLTLEEQLASGFVPVIVPEHFTEHAVSENLYAGKGMGRRASYQYGVFLEQSETGKMAMGIGMGQSTGTVGFIRPTYEIRNTGEVYTIDGVTMEFQMTPGTEAPAEMNIWFPEMKALWVAENCTATLHNLYTLRGAQIRDGNAWAKYITEAIALYGNDVQLTFQSHNWPHWGNEFVNDYLADTAAVYKFINDMTLTYINQGYTSDEISNMIELPDELAKNWYTRQYYGTVAHNSKAVYQKYMGWYDANPVNLNPLEPSESAKKWVEYLGDTNEVLRKAKADFDKGEYQWVAEVTNVLVFADPENKAARLLCADALEQLGYQAESGTWRNAYLSAALELRSGNAAQKGANTKTDGSLIRNMTAEMIFDYAAILLDKEAISNENFKINIVLSDTQEKIMLHFNNGALLQYANKNSDDAELTVTCPQKAIALILQKDMNKIKASMKLEGDASKLELIVNNLNQFDSAGNANFNIVEP